MSWGKGLIRAWAVWRWMLAGLLFAVVAGLNSFQVRRWSLLAEAILLALLVATIGWGIGAIDHAMEAVGRGSVPSMPLLLTSFTDPPASVYWSALRTTLLVMAPLAVFYWARWKQG